MSGFLTHLAERTLGLVPVLEPRPRSRFEAAGDSLAWDENEPGDGVPYVPPVPSISTVAAVPPATAATARTAAVEAGAARPGPVPAPVGGAAMAVGPAATEDPPVDTDTVPAPVTGRANGPRPTWALPGLPVPGAAVPSPPVPDLPVRGDAPRPPSGTGLSGARSRPPRPVPGPHEEPRPAVAADMADLTAGAARPSSPRATGRPEPGPGSVLPDHAGAVRDTPGRRSRPTPGAVPPIERSLRDAIRDAMPPPAHPGQRPPQVTVNIGRVEVRTTPRPGPPAEPRPRPARRGEPDHEARPLSLDDYLTRRENGGP